MELPKVVPPLPMSLKEVQDHLVQKWPELGTEEGRG